MRRILTIVALSGLFGANVCDAGCFKKGAVCASPQEPSPQASPQAAASPQGEAGAAGEGKSKPCAKAWARWDARVEKHSEKISKFFNPPCLDAFKPKAEPEE